MSTQKQPLLADGDLIQNGTIETIEWNANVHQQHSDNFSGSFYLYNFHRMVQIGMDENGTVTNVNFIKRDVESCPSDNMVGQFDWDRDSDEIRDNFDENETEDESSGILVAAGGVEVTTRDAAVAGVGLLIGIGCSVITRWLRPKQRVDLGRAGDAKDAYDLISIKNQLDEIDSAEGEPLLKDLFVQDEY